MDTYGLGVALLELFTRMDERGLLDPTLSAFLLNDFFPELMALNLKNRAPPEHAIAMLEKFIADNYPDLLPKVPTAADESARLIRTMTVLGATPGSPAAAGGGNAINLDKLTKALKVLKRPENNVDVSRLIANMKISNATGGAGAGAKKGGRHRGATRKHRRS